MRARRLLAAVVAVLLLAACGPGAQGRGAEGAGRAEGAAEVTGADRAELEARMAELLGAVRAGDAAAFAAQFSRERPWRYVLNSDIATPDTVHSSRDTTEVSPERLRRDLATRGEFFSYFLDPGNRGVGSVGMAAEQDVRWVLVDGGRFVPEGGNVEIGPSVRWRREGGRWVVDEIAEWYH